MPGRPGLIASTVLGGKVVGYETSLRQSVNRDVDMTQGFPKRDADAGGCHRDALAMTVLVTERSQHDPTARRKTVVTMQ